MSQYLKVSLRRSLGCSIDLSKTKKAEAMLQGLHEETRIRYSTKQKQNPKKWSENLQVSQDSQHLSASSSHRIRLSLREVHSRIWWRRLRYSLMNTIIASVIRKCSKTRSDLSSHHFATLLIDSVSYESSRVSASSLVMSSRRSITSQISTTISLLSSPGSSTRCSLHQQISAFRKSHSS